MPRLPRRRHRLRLRLLLRRLPLLLLLARLHLLLRLRRLTRPGLPDPRVRFPHLVGTAPFHHTLPRFAIPLGRGSQQPVHRGRLHGIRVCEVMHRFPLGDGEEVCDVELHALEVVFESGFLARDTARGFWDGRCGRRGGDCGSQCGFLSRVCGG